MRMPVIGAESCGRSGLRSVNESGPRRTRMNAIPSSDSTLTLRLTALLAHAPRSAAVLQTKSAGMGVGLTTDGAVIVKVPVCVVDDPPQQGSINATTTQPHMRRPCGSDIVLDSAAFRNASVLGRRGGQSRFDRTPRGETA